MLVLSRKKSEVIRIGEDIKITVVSIEQGYKVKIGIDAPQNVAVHREEVYHEIRRDGSKPSRKDQQS
jgi:carbon storage regulator